MLFWDVDTQVDFLNPAGRLYVPGGEKIIPNLRRLTAWAGEHDVPVISSADAHRPGDPELQIYGEHCMVGTPGQQKVQETLLPRRFIVPNRTVELPDLTKFQQVIIEKQAFDFASNPNSEPVLQQFAAEPEITLYGVVTEICVAAAARSLITLGRKIRLVRDAITALDPAKAEEFLAELARRGGKFVIVEDLMAARVSPA
jgi:nicotinamidase/pyrazinamidase